MPEIAPLNNTADSESFKFKSKITVTTPAAGNIKGAQIDASLKDLS